MAENGPAFLQTSSLCFTASNRNHDRKDEMHWTRVSKEVAIRPHYRALVLCEQLRVEWAIGQKTPTQCSLLTSLWISGPGSQPSMGQQKGSVYQLEYLQ